ncbi:hypothetical protein [Taylorella equigenitalis]|uniref:Transglycosylase SLT domain-containing protein n=2 Tax=Taylorella equigenitalis TaxID=29575 RepID=I7JJP9_9BURK|nr:hypothetical protein [Taylorella equigenitalis]AFN35935.1 hypothetical protein KUI_0861 [Taylorella equigenitalis ATCC 35865]ASY37876.1 hypothetical protein CA605_04105 [Taylorella equigenitalis]ASY39344.1 hypothetical protein CA604_04290 [Taylorella equigenitalis]ASY40862.1 hypothetical protein CAV20_04115 [Taylorella equigenitalis]ASY42296.1 hypothetical protein CA943_04115 [Taylorella equigenitalis]
MKLNILLLVTTFFLVSCASNKTIVDTAPPKDSNNICSILSEKPQWHESLKQVKEKWLAPPQVVMAIIYQESKFVHDARPAKRWALGLVPLGRPSDAYGYPQAKDDVWRDYIRDTNNSGARRDVFSDAVDFIGWYMAKSNSVNAVSRWDTYNQYLNYHEGWGGYSRGTYESKDWLKTIASKVASRAELYGSQYQLCRD